MRAISLLVALLVIIGLSTTTFSSNGVWSVTAQTSGSGSGAPGSGSGAPGSGSGAPGSGSGAPGSGSGAPGSGSGAPGSGSGAPGSGSGAPGSGSGPAPPTPTPTNPPTQVPTQAPPTDAPTTTTTTFAPLDKQTTTTSRLSFYARAHSVDTTPAPANATPALGRAAWALDDSCSFLDNSSSDSTTTTTKDVDLNSCSSVTLGNTTSYRKYTACADGHQSYMTYSDADCSTWTGNFTKATGTCEALADGSYVKYDCGTRDTGSAGAVSLIAAVAAVVVMVMTSIV